MGITCTNGSPPSSVCTIGASSNPTSDGSSRDYDFSASKVLRVGTRTIKGSFNSTTFHAQGIYDTVIISVVSARTTINTTKLSTLNGYIARTRRST